MALFWGQVQKIYRARLREFQSSAWNQIQNRHRSGRLQLSIAGAATYMSLNNFLKNQYFCPQKEHFLRFLGPGSKNPLMSCTRVLIICMVSNEK